MATPDSRLRILIISMISWFFGNSGARINHAENVEIKEIFFKLGKKAKIFGPDRDSNPDLLAMSKGTTIVLPRPKTNAWHTGVNHSVSNGKYAVKYSPINGH
jgi:hypothetical protein